jgi:uncharacterized protein (TIGR03435 family)
LTHRIAGALLLAAAVSSVAIAQARPEFEVATIKPNQAEGGPSSVRATQNEVILENTSLRKCIATAYGIGEDRDYALVTPDWMRFAKFDVIAKFAPGTPRDQLMLMLQNLLADRFKVKLHRESRQLPVYALVVVPSGSKLHESAPGTPGQISMGGTHITGRGTPMQSLADHLSNAALQLDRPVIDQTGLRGNYDFTLEWTADSVQTPDAVAPSLFTAVQEQLGLKLEARKAPVEIIVVDSAEKSPTEN